MWYWVRLMGKASVPREVAYMFKSLGKGLTVTLRNLFRKKSTVLYPEVELPISERFRGMVGMPVDPKTGTDRCLACGACMRICPEEIIEVVSEVGEDKKRKLVEYKIDISRCMWCGLCTEVCPNQSLVMTRHYELAVDSRDKMKFDRKQLQEKGGLFIVKPEPEELSRPKKAQDQETTSETPAG